MHAWHGHDERRIPPLVLGHEAVGIAGDGPFAGQRVAINPLMTCGDCDACNSGNEHLCPQRELIGMRVPGAFAEQVAINNKNLTPIADGLSFENAALAEPLACAVNSVNQAIKHTPDRDAAIAVLGGGAIGLLAAKVFECEGYNNISIAETNELRRRMLEQLGNFKPYDPIATSPSDASIDIVLDAVGSGITRRAGSAMVRPGGIIVHIGLQDSNPDLIQGELPCRKLPSAASIAIVPAILPDRLPCLKLVTSPAQAGPRYAILTMGPKPFRTSMMAKHRRRSF